MLSADETLRLVEDIDRQSDETQRQAVRGFLHRARMSADKQKMRTPAEIDEQLRLIEGASDEDTDELLEDLLVLPWPTKTSQDN